MAEFDVIKHHHTDDPLTSVAAAESVRRIAKKHKWRIVADLIKNGPSTAEEISSSSGLKYYQVLRRLTDLHADKRIERTGETRRNKSGRDACVWRITR